MNYIQESKISIVTNTDTSLDNINTNNNLSKHTVGNPRKVCSPVYVCYTYYFSTELQIWNCTPHKLINGMEALYNKLGTELQMEREG